MSKILVAYQGFCQLLSRSLTDIALLLMRLLTAKVFLDSGLLKWSGWFDFDEQQYDLFLYEFFCPDPIRPGALLLCDPETLEYAESSSMVAVVEWLAYLAGVMEVLLPVLLIAGLLTRLGAIGLLGMTLFIQFAVFPSWSHWWNPAAWWFMGLLVIVASGPGRLSFDHLLTLDRRRH